MFRRLLRSTIVLAAIIGAYQVYVLFAVPQMEPSLAVRERHQADRADLDRAAKSVSKYQRLLANYFPETHWSQVRPPKVFANSTETTMLVIDDYTRHPESVGNEKSTQVDIKRFAMLMFPTTPAHEGITPPRDAIVLEAQQGASLLFADFHPELGRIGQITRGLFSGPITIRSDMREPGPQDDLLVETSDLQMNTKLLYTASPVRFRMGQNVGGGTELEIRFIADEHAQPGDNGLKIAGFDSLEIRRDVRMRMQLNTYSLLPGGNKDSGSHAPRGNPIPGRSGGEAGVAPVAATQSVAGVRSQTERGNESKPQNPSVQVKDATNSPPPPPVDITCNGPFTFDFVRYVASIDRDVVVRQLNPNGPCDQLNCNQLDIHFAPKAAAPDAKPEPVVVDPSKRQQRDLGRLEAAAIIALGHPAIAVSPSRKVEARGDRIWIGLREQRLRIEGGNDTRLTDGVNVLQAPIIDYQHPDADSTSQIGRFRATGPGSLHYVTDATKPDQVFQAAWQTSVQLDREKGQPVIVMEGRPELAFAAAGSLIADHIRFYLRELDGNATAGVAVGGGGDKKKQSRLAPDRLIATGHVDIDSPQFAGRTQQLLANFQIQPETAAGAVKPGKAAPAGPAGPLASAVKTGGGPGSDPPQQTYQLVADQMRLEVLMKGQTAVPSTLTCDGHIVVRGVSPTATNEQPMEIRGEQLFVDKLDSKTPHITLKGAGADGAANGQQNSSAAGKQLAQISGHGVTLLTDWVEMDGHDNHMWSDGPGEATVMARDPQGNASAAPTPVNIHWQNGLRFDGQTITFDRDVIVASADRTLHCDRMLARLAAPIQFGQHIDQTATSFSQIDCLGQVTIENLSRDLRGVTSHDRMQLGHLTINQQTGDIRGEGPGVIRSTRFGDGLGPMNGPQAAKPRAASANGSKLHFLRVDFHTGLSGNMYTRMVTFHDRVRSVYGPVDAWEQELDLTRPETLPPESMTLSSDELQLNEDPHVAQATPNPAVAGAKPMGAIQMQATSNVRIAGQTPDQQDFRIQANRASYDAAKEVLRLEGDTRTPAKLWRRTRDGVDAPPLEATKMSYNRLTNEPVVDGVQYLEINSSDLQKAERPAKAPKR